MTKPSVACRDERHAKCTGRASQGNRVTYSVARPCPCPCHGADVDAYQAYVARYGYEVPRVTA